jgi:phosphoglycolate phosphatase-like HAD superfamily hydrolase
MAMKVLLWDIDGTLVCTGGAGERAISKAMRETFGVEATLDGIDYRGRTDRYIGQRLFEFYGIEGSEENLNRFLEGYLWHLERELPQAQGKTHAGVLDILHRADGDGELVQGLLTGNMRRGAELKLSYYGVWNYFLFGAFADDSPVRDELGWYALERASAVARRAVNPRDVFVIGDTPHDIACGKAIGAQTIAVATGAYCKEDLERYRPTAVFEDLGDVEKFFEVVEGA